MLVNRFETIVSKYPEKTAVELGPRSVSYRELNESANRLAHALLSHLTGEEPARVGILLTGRIDQVVAMIGVLKARTAYVPLDPHYPKDRLMKMVRDSGLEIIVTSSEHTDLAISLCHETGGRPIPVLDISESRDTRHSPENHAHGSPGDTAYILYTSGSSGTPKGVPQLCENVLFYADRYIDVLSITPDDRISYLSSFSHDGAVNDIYAALMSGAALCPFDMRGKSGLKGIGPWMEEKEITVYHSVVSVFRYMSAVLEPGLVFPRLRLIVTGGEPLQLNDILSSRERFPGIPLAHMYGMTESSVNTMGFIDTSKPVERITIGEPLEGIQLLVLNSEGEEVETFETGEIFVACPHIAPGYWGNPEATGGAFFRDEELGPLYRTGDLGRLGIDDSIEFAGRKDHQVKIHGFRIELPEIEQRLRLHNQIEDAVVVVLENKAGENFLYTYAVPDSGNIDQAPAPAELVAYLGALLPDYMVPLHYHFLERFPLSVTGKVDRRALPEPRYGAGHEYTAPSDPVEEKLEAIWAGLLEIDKSAIGIDADFFALGGHSLRATILITRIHKEFHVEVPLAAVFSHPTIRRLARVVRETKTVSFASIQPVEARESYPLSYAQLRMYLLAQIDAGGTGYNMPRIIPLGAGLDIQRAERAFRLLVRRHESLRTSFHTVDNVPVQTVHDADTIDFTVQITDLSQTVDIETVPEAIRETVRAFTRPFDLSRAPLMRAGVVIMPDRNFLLMVDMHHIISDQSSVQLLTREFTVLYRGEPLPPNRIQYKDYAVWQQAPARREILKKQETFWLQQFSGDLPVLDLPLDFPRPPVQQFDGARVVSVLEAENAENLRALASRLDATLYMVLMGIMKILLARLSGNTDIVLGTVTAGRRHADLETVIGMFVNTLAIRTEPLPGKSVESFLREVKEINIKAQENQEYPFEELVEQLPVSRTVNRNPLFDVMFSYYTTDANDGYDSGINHRQAVEQEDEQPLLIPPAKFDLTALVADNGQQVVFYYDYCTALFKEETVKRFARYFNTVAAGLDRYLQGPIDHLEILSPEEKHTLISRFNDTGFEVPRDVSYTRLFRDQVQKTPEAVALVAEDGESMSYRELDNRSDNLASLLLEKNAGSGAVVALIARRSPLTVAGMLGIMKAGAAYMPVDPQLPDDRIRFMLMDSHTPVVVTAGGEPLTDGFSGYPIVEIHGTLEPPQNRVGESDDPAGLAYVIYTSGTTGRPKGTLIEHGALINMCYWHNRYYRVSGEDRATQYAPLVFDASVWEIFPYLISGASVFIIPESIKLDIPALSDFFRQHRVTIGFLPTQFFQQFIEAAPRLPSLRALLTGGDKLGRFVATSYRLYNNYGPTENTVVATCFPVEHDYTDIPIGSPVDNTRVYVLSKDSFHLRPVGVPGELCIAGNSLARGYLNRPELTHRKFINATGSDPRRGTIPLDLTGALYRTGDWVKWSEDGNLIFLGRIDTQVKLRGYRIELAEIEQRLLSSPLVKETVVTAVEDNENLCAYIVPTDENIDEDRFREQMVEPLREGLSHVLPGYMIPSYFTYLDRIPLTANGKVDTRALPRPRTGSEGDTYVPPRNGLEEKLADIWTRVLFETGAQPPEGVKIGIDDNFFHIGGHSLKATVMVSLIHKELETPVPLSQLFLHPTIRELAIFIGRSVRENFYRIETAEGREFYPLSSAQNRLYLLHRMEPHRTQYNLMQTVPLGHLDSDRMLDVFRQLMRRHESLRTSFHMMSEIPVQKIHPADSIFVEVEELQPGEGGWDNLVRDFVRPFQLDRAPLFRVGTIADSSGNGAMLIDMHHIITDGVSQDVLKREFAALYNGETLPAPRLQYKDFAVWQSGPGTRKRFEQMKNFWLRRFESDVPVLDLPYDFPRPMIQEFDGSFITFSLSRQETDALRDLSKISGTTLFMTVMSVFYLLLSRISGSEDIVVGTPVAGRSHADLQEVIGMFVNTLPVRAYPDGVISFNEFLQNLKDETLQAFENQDYPFERIVEDSAVRRDAGRNPLFDVMFTLRNRDGNLPAGESDEPGNIFRGGPSESKFDLSLDCFEYVDRLFITMQYCTRLFVADTIERFGRYFMRLVAAVVQEPGQPLFRYPILDTRERKRLVEDFNGNIVEVNAPMTLHERFINAAEQHPGRVALSGPGTGNRGEHRDVQLTYEMLNARSDRTAARLLSRGAKTGDIIAITAFRSVDVLIQILGIMKTGSAYLPIDPQYPPDRVRYMLNDSAASLLITSAQMSKQGDIFAGWNGTVLSWDDIPDDTAVPVSGENGGQQPAYLIYTSGSTGKPKGVLVEHRNAVSYLTSFLDRFPLITDDVMMQQASFAFDASVEEIYPILSSGGRLVMPAPETSMDMALLTRFILSRNITITSCSPHLLNELDRHMAAGNVTAPVHTYISGGDQLKHDYIAHLVKDAAVYNTYGPTETTVCATYHRCAEEPVPNVPIGKPIANYTVFILNKYHDLVPVGVPGELCISGPGVTRGYLNNPELTAEKFVSPNGFDLHWGTIPYAPDAIHSRSGEKTNEHANEFPGTRFRAPTNALYKSGDLAMWNVDGEVVFLGRIDRQVQVRGYRIELGEIESRLELLDPIRQAVVLAREDNAGHLYLCAYVVPADNTVRPGSGDSQWQKLKEHLAVTLPEYMIPQYFVAVDSIPLTPQGKVSASKLPEPEIVSGEAYQAPRDEIEIRLVEIWSGVLGIEKEKIGIDDNFFQLGGNSIKVMAVGSRIKEVLDKDIPVVKLFVYPTIRTLSGFLTPEQSESGELQTSAAAPKDRSEILGSRRDRIKAKRKRK